ncbi:LysR family transcriptional regulator [Pseudomonas songnenensis]|uniref:LysR family transcriptional regulator n=1 Tax=Pseudomonas songnenensis TaxID=1176259 RepID=A0A482UA17_9PSED|nr:LysR substrate-binding domain-containing protein [Pseudomonas songnenensis]RYJ64149.1 LysR family transcriptional regulator [Pseudomonas songnenensis]
MFELAQLRCFTTLASELNFRRAAERLNMTQPPLSRQIQLLEHQLGVALFTRSTRSVALTAAGRAFFVEAQALLDQAHRAAQGARLAALGESGSLTISFVASAVYDFLPRAITQIRRERPGVAINLLETTTFEQLQALRGRRVDLAVVREPLQQPGLVSECLLREPFVLAAPVGHPLAQHPAPTLVMLHGEPFILYAHGAWQPFNELHTGLFRAAGLGLALVPRGASAIRFQQVRFRELPLPAGICAELHLAWRDDNDNPALEAARDAVRQAAGGRRHCPQPAAALAPIPAVPALNRTGAQPHGARSTRSSVSRS